jgi:glycosyltransferase involved in cell wall biosynthesis
VDKREDNLRINMSDLKKKIAIVSPSYMWFPDEQGPSRFYYISKLLAESGFDVEVITGSFEHFTKSRRNVEKILNDVYPFRVKIIETPEYQKNISLKREWSYHIFLKRLMKYLQEGQHYDLVYCSVPPNNVSAMLGEYCKKQGIPLVADIEDLWPELMKSRRHIPIFENVIYYPFHYCAEKTYKLITAAVGTSDEYANRTTKYNKRNIIKVTAYVGCDIDEFDKEVDSNIDKINKPQDEVWITYAGSIASSYDIKNLVDVGIICKDNNLANVKIKILGTGVMKDKLEQYAKEKGCSNVEFLGYIDHPKMAAYLKKSDLLVNSFAKGVSQSIVNKVGDYFAAGKPILNTLENAEFCNLVNEYQVGVNVESESPQKLYDAIIKLLNSNELIENMSINSRKLAELKFDRKVSYIEIVKLVQCLTD